MIAGLRKTTQETSLRLEGSNSQGLLQNYNTQLQAIKSRAESKIEAIKNQEKSEIENLDNQYIQAQSQALIGSSLEEFESIMENTPERLKKPIQDIYFPAALKYLSNLPASQREDASDTLDAQRKSCDWFDSRLLHSLSVIKSERKNSLHSISNIKKAVIVALTLGVGVTGYELAHQKHKPASVQPQNVPANPSTFSGKSNK